MQLLCRLIGGKGESHANVAEGLATALQCFEDLQEKRDGNTNPQKHCILVCNSPPYMMPCVENHLYSGQTAEQLATVLQEVCSHTRQIIYHINIFFLEWN